ncbi:MAG: FAD:protein FMN transferase, partial [Myxococcales bacterium]|nr:FAD:protein FMN transferase [Myxococcales bacterium]
LAKARPAIACDLSAVAKGYAVDELARALGALGHERFLVEVGGELRGRGGHLDGAPWRVAIEAPVTLDREIHRVLALRDLSMATSGDYRNYYEQDGRRISHTLDPRSGRPIEHRLASVTVLHPEAVWADAWATALNVLGPDEGYTVAVEQGLAAYFIVRADVPTDEGSYGVRMTAAFEPHLADAPEAAPGP